jgi:cytochrome P450
MSRQPAFSIAQINPADFDSRAQVTTALREEFGPVYFDQGVNTWVVLGLDPLLDAAKDKDNERFSSRIVAFDPNQPQRWDALLSNAFIFLDGKEHAGMRGAVRDGFGPRAVREFHSAIESSVVDLTDRIHANGSRFDVVKDFAVPLPVAVMGKLLGIPEADRAGLLASASKFFTVFSSLVRSPQLDALGNEASTEIDTYFTTFLERVRSGEVDSTPVTQYFLQGREAGHFPTEQILRVNLAQMWVGGIFSTTSIIGRGTSLLLEHPDQLAQLRATPSLIPAATQELLRYVSPLYTINRVATKDTEFWGQRITRGDSVILVAGAANRDPSRFEDPDVLNLQRFADQRSANKAATPAPFGTGLHVCLGERLANRELELAFAALVGLNDLTFASPTRSPDTGSIPISLGPSSLPVSYDGIQRPTNRAPIFGT